MLGTREKLETLIRNNQIKYFKLAISYLKNKEDSLDALHNAIVKALQSYPRLRNEKYMDTWFCRILINECLILIKKREKELTLEKIEYYNSQEPLKTDSENFDLLYKAISKLEDNLKNIIILRYYNEMSIKQIAKITDTNLNTTKSRLYKALSILKKEMEIEYEKER